jgi:predicted DNA binding CopG/RHH family protein
MNMTKRKEPIFKLDNEEQALSDSVDSGEWASVKKLAQEQAKAKLAAANYFRKSARINIRISEIDLEHIKQRAAYEGLPYQTLIASILHKYAAGHLQEKRD